MSENGSSNKQVDIYQLLPFMQEFPFNDYEISVEVEGTDPTNLGISQILIDKFGLIGAEYRVNFLYSDSEAAMIAVSLYLEDIQYIAEISTEITKIDAVASLIEEGLASDSIETKIKNIKKSKKFINQLDLEKIFSPQFNQVLHDLLKVSEVALTSSQVSLIQRLNATKLKEQRFSKKELETIFSYLNFQLHYARILLGIVIGYKIY